MTGAKGIIVLCAAGEQDITIGSVQVARAEKICRHKMIAPFGIGHGFRMWNTIECIGIRIVDTYVIDQLVVIVDLLHMKWILMLPKNTLRTTRIGHL